MGGTGGSSGKIDFPPHLKDTHKDWLGYTVSGVDSPVDTDLIQVMNNALAAGNNPWEYTLTDPANNFNTAENRYDTYETEVDALDEETDWESIINTAVSKVDAQGILVDLDTDAIVKAARSGADTSLQKAVESAINAIDKDVIEEAVKSYQRSTNIQKEKTVNRFSATMADINAVNSSAYMFGLAIIEAQHLQDVDQFQSKLELQAYDRLVQGFLESFRVELQSRLKSSIINKDSREKLLREGAQIMVQMLSSRIRAISDTAKLTTEQQRLRSAAVREYELADVDLNYKFAQWDFEVFQNASNVFGAIHGSAAKMPAQPSDVGSAIGGALSGGVMGAQAGASIGAAGGPITAAGGAGIGALLGVGASLL